MVEYFKGNKLIQEDEGKSMKMGILTYHQANNYGAVLQAYALKQYIQNMDCDVEIVNYECDFIEKRTTSLIGIIKKILVGRQIKDTKKKFSEFRKEFLQIKDPVYTKETIVEANSIYDSFIVGSDQVWNMSLNGGDKTYLLDFVLDDTKKNSYAASIGLSELDRDTECIYKEYLDLFRCISVREDRAKIMLVKLLDKNVSHNIDPVFLLKKSQWEELIRHQPYKERYLLIYSFSLSEEMYNVAIEIAEKLNLKIVSISNSPKNWNGIAKAKGVGPLDFLSLFYYADFILTNSFHGTAFSIIFNKKFLVEKTDWLKSRVSRIDNLLELFGLQNRDMNNYKEEMPRRIDYSDVNMILESEHLKSKKFLLDVIYYDTV